MPTRRPHGTAAISEPSWRSAARFARLILWTSSRFPKSESWSSCAQKVWVSVRGPVAAKRGQEYEAEEETGPPYVRRVVRSGKHGCASGRQTPQDRNSVQSREGHWSQAPRKQKRGSDCAEIEQTGRRRTMFARRLAVATALSFSRTFASGSGISVSLTPRRQSGA